MCLTDQQIGRQDLLDNLIFKLLNNLAPEESNLKWDIELIGEVRDYIRTVLVDNLKLMTEMEFYPYIVDEFHG